MWRVGSALAHRAAEQYEIAVDRRDLFAKRIAASLRVAALEVVAAKGEYRSKRITKKICVTLNKDLGTPPSEHCMRMDAAADAALQPLQVF